MTWIIKTKPNCPYCVRAKEALKIRSIEYIEQTHDDETKIAAFIAAGFRTFPQIFKDGHHIGGYEDLVRYFEETEGF